MREQEASPSYDPLTQALDRPSFLAALRARQEQADASGEAFCICLVDVDKLQNINDRHGFDVGDKVLAALAQRVRATLAQPGWHAMQHTLARYDGDALIVLAHPCSSRQGEQLAEALRFHVAEAPVHDQARITVSLGVAQYRVGESVDELLARTERALHVAKQFGRDRVEVAKSPASRTVRAPISKLRD